MGRCELPNEAGNHSSLCCRVAGHDGDCHRHISTVLVRDRAHTTYVRGSMQQVHCAEGAARDGVA